jgi:hypothetical protein
MNMNRQHTHKTWSVLLLFALSGIFLNAKAQLLYEDDFSKEVNFSTSAYANYQNGIYHIFAKKGRMVYDTGHPLRDFVAEIKTEFIDGDDKQGYGMFFRAKDYENYYYFGIAANGNFELGYYRNNKWFEICKWKKSSAINLSGINFLRVACTGAQIELFVNGLSVGKFADKNYSYGYLGIIAFDDVHVHFDDLKVYKAGTALDSKYNFAPEIPNTEADYAPDSRAYFLDNFLNRTHHWAQSEEVHYERGYYNMADDNSGHYSWLSIPQTDFVYEVNLKVSKWQKNGSAGIQFRMKDSDNCYGFFITEDSAFYLEKSVRGTGTVLVPHTPVRFDQSKVQTLRVECQGPHFKLFLNGTELAVAEDPENLFQSETNFGFYVSKGMNANVLSVIILPVPFSLRLAAMDLATSGCFWTSVIVIGGLVFGIHRSRKTKRQAIQNQREKEIFDMIKGKDGVLSLGDVMFKYKISKKKAEDTVERITREYGGSAQLNPDGGLVYEFPDFMPSEDKLRREIIEFAGMRSGRLTVTDTANYLKQDLNETEIILDKMVDGKRIKKDVENEITYYDFVEILSERKRKK